MTITAGFIIIYGCD